MGTLLLTAWARCARTTTSSRPLRVRTQPGLLLLRGLPA